MTSDARKPEPNNRAQNDPLRFVSIGECMVELAPATAAAEYRLGFAGDTFNTVWYAKTLAPQWTTRFVSRVGQDAVSDQMVAMMRDAQIDTDHVLRSNTRSVGLYLISLDRGERSFSYWRDGSAARLLAQDRDVLDAALQDADIVYFTGITLAILDDDGRDTLLDAMTAARAAGKTVVFDSNLRPRLWASDAQMTQAVMRAAAVSDIVLPSYDDEAAFFGDADPEATRARYRGAGATTVVVKNGEGEIFYLRDGQTGAFTPKAATAIVDTTSAGDSFNAGLLVGLDRTGDIEQAIEFACAVAGHVIGQKGALVPLPEAFA